MGTLDIVVSKEVMFSSRLSNIKIWKSTMKSILMKEDLWDLVEDVIVQPKTLVQPNFLVKNYLKLLLMP